MRKPQLQPALASLTSAEREQLADWLRRGDYDDVLARVNQPRPEGFGLNISKSPLQTFYAKVALLDVINAQLPADKKLSLATFESLSQRHIHLFLSASGDEEKLAAAHQAILNTTVELAGTATTPTQLLALQRLADFPERAALRAAKEQRAQEMHDHKIALALRKEAHTVEINIRKQDRADRAEQRASERLDLAKRSLAIREQQASDLNSKLKTQNSKLDPKGRPADHLGPIATNWKEVGQRVCKLFNISPEEEARRAELHKTWKDPHARPGIPEEINPVLDDDDLWSVDPAPEPEPTNSPASCEDAVATEELPDPLTPSTASTSPSQQETPLRDLNSPSERLTMGNTLAAGSGNQIDAPPSTKNQKLNTQNSNNPTPAPLTRDQRLAEFYKGMAAQAAENLKTLNAHRASLAAESESPAGNG